MNLLENENKSSRISKLKVIVVDLLNLYLDRYATAVTQ